MSFTSISFVLFVGITAGIYFNVKKDSRWIVLLLASYVFYLLSSPKTFVFVLVTTITTFYGARVIGQYELKYKAYIKENKESLERAEKKKLKAANTKRKRKVLLGILLINFGILAFLKYFRVYINDLAIHFNGEPVFDAGFLIPLGISFYTFQSMGYLIDVYRGKYLADDNLAKFALFVSFFPQIIQGPISRHDQLAPQLYKGHDFDYKRIKFGAQLILWGFFKKLVIADRVGIIVNEIFDNYEAYTGMYMLLAVLGYTIQIYADFSGGMEIARGVSQIFGIDMAKNFDRPYFSRSIPEFWRRWHMTLGHWCRDYIFYPISLSSTFGKIGKKSRKIFGERIGKLFPVIIAQLITFFTIGIWHGAEFKFIAYGLYQAIFIIGGILLEPYFKKLIEILHINTEAFSWRLFQIVRTFIIVVIGRFFSRATSFTAAIIMMKKSLVFNPRIFFDGSILELGLTVEDYGLLLVAILLWIFISVLQESGMKIRERLAEQNILFRWLIYLTAITVILVCGIYGSGFDASGFIYREF